MLDPSTSVLSVTTENSFPAFHIGAFSFSWEYQESNLDPSVLKGSVFYFVFPHAVVWYCSRKPHCVMEKVMLVLITASYAVLSMNNNKKVGSIVRLWFLLPDKPVGNVPSNPKAINMGRGSCLAG